MYKAINIKWETDGYEVDLPNEVDIPERFIDKDGVDEESVADWLSYTFEYVHDGFEVVDECKALFDKICKPIPTYALSDEIGLDTGTSYILNLEMEENYTIAEKYLKELCPDYNEINKKYIGNKIIVELYCNGENEWWFCNHGTVEEYFINAKITLKRYMSNIKW